MFTHVLTVLLMLFQGLLASFTFEVPPPIKVPGTLWSNTTTTGVVTRVIDGDTIDVVLGTSTQTTRIRYIGINTPELYPKYSQESECGSREAAAANETLVKQKTVTVITDVDAFDTYGRLLAYVYVGDMFINKELLIQGYATTLFIKPNIQYRSEFTQLRDVAETAQIGNWKICPDWH